MTTDVEQIVSRDTANKVRQILMNELGVTRKFVREEMEKIIEQTIERHFQAMIDRNYFKDLAEKKTLEYLKKSRWEEDEIRKMIGEAAKQKAMAEFDKIYGG